jgi:hypothetical protein
MSVRRLVVSMSVVAAAVLVPAAPSHAAVPDVYVATPAAGGDDAHDCSVDSPCATVARAVAVADPSGTTVHVGAGTFDGAVTVDKTVTIDGLSPAETVLTTPQETGPGYVLAVTAGTTSLSHIQLEGGMQIGAWVGGAGSLEASHTWFTDAGCNLAVVAGSATLSDSVVQNGGGGCAAPGFLTGEVVVTGGSVSLVRSQVLSPVPTEPSVRVTGGDFSADFSSFDDSSHDRDTNASYGVTVTGGSATISRSSFRGFGMQGVHNDGGAALVADSTFAGNVVGVDGTSGSTTVLRSTFTGELAAVQGTISVAGSVLGPDLVKNCNPAGGTITDLGYNLATDGTCGFAGTSRGGVSDLGLDTVLADHGGPVPTVATSWQSPAVDYIPAEATYGGSSTPLCASTDTDARGVPRPQSGACDAGSMELVSTTTSLQAPSTAEPHALVSLDATVNDPDVGVSGLGTLAGTVTFSSGATVLCAGLTVQSGTAHCATSALAAGSRPVQATFTPAPGATWHSSLATRTIKVGTAPAFTSGTTARFVVGKAHTFTLLASGSPSARITLIKGRVPAGLVFRSGLGKATLSGKAKASAVGTRQLTLQATNPAGSVRQVLRVVVRR